MIKYVAYHKPIYGDELEKLQCSLCGDDNYNNLVVERLGIAVGMGGEEYDFCKKCFFSKDFSQKLLVLLGFNSRGMKLENSSLVIKEEKT